MADLGADIKVRSDTVELVSAGGPECEIYKITNQKNGKVYVGQTWKGVDRRFKLHIRDSKASTNKGFRTKLSYALRKYGHESFVLETIATAQTQVEADHLEDKFIVLLDSIKSGYNIRSGGSRGKLSPETRAKLSKANTGKVRTAEMRQKLSVWMTGRKLGPVSQETREKIAAKHRGQKATDETRARISAGLRGKKHSSDRCERRSDAQRLKWTALSLEERELFTQRLVSSRGKRTREWLDQLVKGLNPIPVSKTEKIVTAISQCPQLCYSRIAEDIYGEDTPITRRRVNNLLNSLRKRLVVERIGDSKPYHWRVLWERFK